MNRRSPPSLRRLVLGGALLAATLCAILPDPPPANAADVPSAPLLQAQAAADAARDTAKEASRAARDAARDAKAAADAATREAAKAGDDTDADSEPPARRHKGITINLDGADRQYDSFDQFLDRDPALAGLVFGIVFVVFLTPILIIGLIVWYKMRKSRMQNETMLKLAEKGIVPPAEAVAAVGSGRMTPLLDAVAANAPLEEQVRALRRGAAWSDLRKGVLMGTVGFALTLYAMFEDGSPSWIGLVLLFLGIGYVALWYFEDRQAVPGPGARGGGPFPPRGPEDKSN